MSGTFVGILFADYVVLVCGAGSSWKRGSFSQTCVSGSGSSESAGGEHGPISPSNIPL